MVGGNGKGLSAFQSKGKGFELQDLERLLRHYVDWAHMLNPSVDFATVLVQINGLHKGQITEHLSELREQEYRRMNDMQADAEEEKGEDDGAALVEGETSKPNEVAEGGISATEGDEHVEDTAPQELSKEERIRRNREAALKRLKERKLKKAGLQNNPAAAPTVQESAEANPKQAVDDDDIEAMLREQENSKEDLHEPDLDELDALDDLLGQQDPEPQPYNPPSATAAGLEPLPNDNNENTMQSISDAFKPAQDEQSESGVSEAESAMSRPNQNDTSKSNNNPETGSGNQEAKCESIDKKEPLDEPIQNPDAASQAATQVVSRAAEEENSVASSQDQPTQVVGR